MVSRKITLRRLLWAWAALGVVVAFVLGTIAAQGGVDCQREGDWLCLNPGWVFVGTWVVVAVACFLSGLVIAIVWTVVDAWLEHRRGLNP